MKNEFHANYIYENNILAKKKKKNPKLQPQIIICQQSAKLPKNKEKKSQSFVFVFNK